MIRVSFVCRSRIVGCWTAMAEFKARWMMPSYAKNARVAGRGTRSKSLGGV